MIRTPGYKSLTVFGLAQLAAVLFGIASGALGVRLFRDSGFDPLRIVVFWKHVGHWLIPVPVVWLVAAIAIASGDDSGVWGVVAVLSGVALAGVLWLTALAGFFGALGALFHS